MIIKFDSTRLIIFRVLRVLLTMQIRQSLLLKLFFKKLRTL